ncbi:enamelin [Sceloporus undulatus]|uniref:enamelin n=1 Tax=Sceloporus undulatus TaxID=8520 RepID=UPI001C4B0364|nr:enamelin [Sceloporus undulatus]
MQRMMRILLYLFCLIGTSWAALLRKPRKAGFGSKSEEMMQFGPYGYLNSPQLTQLAASLYGYRSGFPQMVPQQPAFNLQRFYLWQQQMPGHQAAKLPQQKPQQNPVPRKPNTRLPPKPRLTLQQPQPKIPQPQPRIPQAQSKIQLPPKQPQTPTYPFQPHPHVPVQQPKGEKQQQTQGFPPHQQQPWHIPQIFGHGGFQPQLFSPYQRRMPFGRPPVSNEEGTPYFGYGYQGMGGRPPYYSEEMFEQDIEEPVEKEAPKESPATDPVTNSTVSDTNSTISNPAGQVGNDTISGLGGKVTGSSSPSLQNKLVSGNRASTPLPTSTHMLEGNGVAQNILEQSSHRSRSPNGHVIQSFPSSSQHSTMQVSNIYKPLEPMGDTKHNTLISRGNPSIHAEDPAYLLNYGRNPNRRDNLPNINSNHPSANTRNIPYGQQEQPHYHERNSLSQRERVSFPSSDTVHQWSKEPVYRDNGPKNFPPKSHSLDPQFKTLRESDNTYNAREDIESFQPPGMHKSNTFSHQGLISATGRTPFEIETHQYDWKEQPFNHPDQKREQFLPEQNPMWNNQEGSQVFQEAPPRYNSVYSSDYFNQRGLPTHLEKNSYSQPIPPRAWEDRDSSPTISPSGQMENPSYSPASPSHQIQRNTYYRRVQPEYVPHPRQDPWTREQHLFDRDNQYSNSPHNPTHHHENTRYIIENPASEISNLPYEKINQWTQEERPPVHSGGHLRQVENVPYQSKSMFGQRERKFQNAESNFPQQSIAVQEEAQYAERNSWIPQRRDPSAQKETPPYINIYSTDIRRNPTHAEDTGGIIHVNAPISNENAPGRRHYLDRMGYSDDYLTERRMMSSPSIANQLCCADDPPVPRENKLAPLRSAPQFRLASWEQKESSIYPEGSHAKYVRHVPSPAGIKSNHPLRNGIKEGEELGAFRVENADLEKSPPCATSQLSQDSKLEANFQNGHRELGNMPCHGSTIRGDRHNILAHLVGTSQSKRQSEKASLKLLFEKFPQPQGIQSEALVSEDNRKEQHAALGAKRIPCFGNWLKQYLSSTGAPSGDRQPNSFYGESLFPTKRPNSMPPEPEPISSTYPSHDAGEKPVKINSPGEEWAGQAAQSTPDCLLLQNK